MLSPEALEVGFTTSCAPRHCAHSDAQALDLFATEEYEIYRLREIGCLLIYNLIKNFRIKEKPLSVAT